MSELPDDTFPKSLDDIPDIAPIKREELIIPSFKESLNEASESQQDIKNDYKKIVEEQAEKLAKLKARIRDSQVDEKNDREYVLFKIANLKEEVDQLEESLHYAKQDYEAWVGRADLSGGVSKALAIVETIERDIHRAKMEISRLEALR
jgi:DNA repair exonuclease SbcCD ATPase subunit